MQLWSRTRFLAISAATALVAAAVTISAGLFAPEPSEAHHGAVRCGGTGELACLATVSPFIENIIKKQGEVTWCLNTRASNYPNFRNQISKVMGQYAKDLGLTHREVVYPTNPRSLDCIVRHDMPENHECAGCGAWIYLLNYPVLIEYNWKQGYTNWESTIGHELGHGFCLLDEHYDKDKFRSWILYYGYWQHGRPTVMDSGTPNLAAYRPLGIWSLTVYDLERCTETIGRQMPPPPPPEFTYGREQANSAIAHLLERYARQVFTGQALGADSLHPYDVSVLRDIAKGFATNQFTYNRKQGLDALMWFAGRYADTQYGASPLTQTLHPFDQSIVMDILSKLP